MSFTVGNLRNTKAGIRCDRTSILGNPFLMSTEENRDVAVKAYREYLYLVACTWEDPECAAKEIAEKYGLNIAPAWRKSENHDFLAELSRIENMSSATLLCWCSPKVCHCDVLVSYLNWSTGQNNERKTSYAGN